MGAKQRLVLPATLIFPFLSGATRRQFKWSLALSVVAGAAEIASVGAILPFLAVAVNDGAVAWNPILEAIYEATGLNLPEFKIFLGVVVLVLVIVANGLGAWAKWSQARVGARAQTEMAGTAMRSHLGKPYAEYLSNNSADYRRDVLGDGPMVAIASTDAAIALVRSAFIALGIFASLLYFRPWTALFIAVFFGGSYAAIYFGLRGPIHRKGQISTTAQSVRHRVGNEAFGSIKEVKFYGVEAELTNEMERASADAFNATAVNRVFGQLPFHALQVIAFGGLMAVFLALLSGVESLSEIIPTLGFVAFAGYRILPSLQEGFAAYASMRAVAPISERMAQQLAPRNGDEQLAIEQIHVNESIRFHDASFQYAGADAPVFSKLNVEIGRGEYVALVGPSGAGKTTFIDLVLGLLTSTAGNVVIDDTVINAENSKGWRKSVGYVPQTVTLHDATVAQNIAFGVDVAKIDMRRVLLAAERAQIRTFVEQDMPHGFDTVVGEGGIRMSGGQRQRLGIARALYRDPDVLVLDEASSNLDKSTETDFAEVVRKLAGEKTIIAISHSWPLVERADRVLGLRSGKVVFDGPPEKLHKFDPAFTALALSSADSQ